MIPAVDHGDLQADLERQLGTAEDLIGREQIDPSDRDGTREAELEEMRELLLARIRDKTHSG